MSLLAAGVSLPILTLAQPARAAVTTGDAINAFPDRDFVVVAGYQLGERLLVEVVRDGVVIGTTQGPAAEIPDGIGLEINHGPLNTEQPGDCWTNYTPDIIGGDVIRVTTLDRPTAAVDTMTVKDVAFAGAPVLEDDGSVSVSGTATPGTSFAVEFRRDKPDPRFRRGPFNPVFEAGTNRWKAVFRPSSTTSAEGLTPEQQRQIALTEASWLAVATSGNEVTLAELGEPGGVGPGCSGSAEPNTLVGGLDPINIASGDVTFSGTARAGVAAVSVTVGALGAQSATFTPNPDAASPWTLTVPKADLLTLPEGNVTVTPKFDALTGTPRTVVKDTSAPAAPTASVPPGTYPGQQAVALNKPAGEGSSKIYWEIGNTAVPDPDQFSNLYTGQIAVTSTQTIKGRLIDAAGNPGAVGSFAYRIGTPPAAPTGLTATESTTAAGAANLRWTAASGATGYNVYRNDVKVNATPLASTATTFADTDAGLGDHSYVVRAVEANGIESLDSNTATVTIAAPALPNGLSATGGDSRVTLNWTAATGVANYRIYRDGVALSSLVAGSASSYINTGLTNGTLYEYAITALDAGGNESPRTGIVQAVPAVPADTTAPTVTARTPAASATGVAVGTNVTATFSEAVQGVSDSTVFLRASGSTTNIAATVTYDATTRVATLDPTANLAAGTTYTATLTGGTTAIRDSANLALATTSWSFTTAAAANTAPTVTARTPAASATGVAVGTNVTATFSEAVQGVSGTTVFLRASGSTTNIAATVTYNATTRVATLDPTANLAAGTTYTATLTGGTTAIRDSANLALATTSWSFTTAAAAGDTVAPTVTTATPLLDSSNTGVSGTANITATFSEAVTGVSSTTFTLRNTATNAAVAATVTYNATTRVATLDPSVTLANDTRYTATLTSGIRDGAGNPLAARSWNFLVGVRPTVTARTPAVSAIGVSRTGNVTATFSEAVVNVNGTTVTLRTAAGTAVAATVTYNATTRVATLDPSATLLANTDYTVRLAGGSSTNIRDAAGNNLSTTTWNFRTGA